MVHQYASGRSALRGPGSTRGWPGNTSLDPIMFDYGNVAPWRGVIVNDGSSHRYLSAPPSLVGPITDVSICEYRDQREGRPTEPTLTLVNSNPLTTGRDHLFAFEGSTGALDGQPPAWSLMGIVLERHHPSGYDVHVAYRGSQSGSAHRAAYQGFVEERGNPDWVTDMEFLENSTDHRISTSGDVVGGLRDSVLSTVGSLVHCLDAIAERNGTAPTSISFTGQSLGGALATQAAAALSIGNIAATLSPELREWPWEGVELIAFSAPKAGDAAFAHALESSISIRRVWALGDPIVEFPFNAHAGVPVPLTTEASGTENHEPSVVRRTIVDQLRWHDPDLDTDQPEYVPWQDFDDLGTALLAAERNGESLDLLLSRSNGESFDAFIDLAANVVETPSSYRIPFTKLPAELRRRGRQLRSAFEVSTDTLDDVHAHMRRFLGIQPGSSVEDHLRRLFILREACRNGWTAADLLDHDGIAKALGTWRRPRHVDGDDQRTVVRAAGPPPEDRDISRVNWILWMRRIHERTVAGSTDRTFRRRVPAESGMPHLVPACSFYPGLEWLPKELMVPKEIPSEAQLISKYKAFYYGLGKIGFGLYERTPIRPEVPWDPDFSWNRAFPETGDGWEQPTADDTFVRLRTQGPNPFLLRRVGDGFELDFSELFDGVLPPICARFDVVDGALTPRNISIGEYVHVPGSDTWDRAKRVVNAADIRCVPFARHLLDVHFIIGQSFALSAYDLPTWHPLRPFLHFFSFGTLQVNDFAYRAFFVGSSYFISSGFMTGEAASALFTNRMRTFDLDDWIPPKDIAKRGLDSLDNHPYVQDSLLVWPELEGMVRRYLAALSYDDESIASDRHLQSWYLTICGLIPNVDARDQPLTFDRLTELLSVLLYNNVIHEICGDMSPILGSVDPDDKAIINLERFIEAVGNGALRTPLPAPTMADVFLMDQASHTSRFNVGGNNMMTLCAARWIDDPKLVRAVEDLQETLRGLEEQLVARNDGRTVRFSRMLPSNWEASISF